jgi:hypothetical protein
MTVYAKINDNKVEKYPYSFMDLRCNYPNTSFPEEMTMELYNEFNVYEVLPTPQPSISDNQILGEGTPEFDGKNWIQTWRIS